MRTAAPSCPPFMLSWCRFQQNLLLSHSPFFSPLLQMLQELARGLHVSEGPLQKQLEAHKRPTPPPLPAGVLADYL